MYLLKFMFFISSLTGNTTWVIGQIPSIPSNILHYHQSINLAELAIINDNYTEALIQYKNAFEILPGFFPDRYNAVLLTQKKYDAELLYNCAEYFYQRGICLEFFAQFPELDINLITRSRNFQKFKFLKNIRVVNLIDSLYSDNLRVREIVPFNTEEVNRVDAANFAIFTKTVAQYGFPSEDVIGVECELDHKQITSRKLLKLLQHFSQGQQTGVDAMLLDAVLAGKLKPEFYADLSVYLGEKNAVPNTPVSIINNQKYITMTNDSIIDQMDQQRKSLGLSSTEEQIIKIRFREKFPQSRYMLPLSSGIANLNGLPPEITNKMVEGGKKF
jgi:hypothetical protein